MLYDPSPFAFLLDASLTPATAVIAGLAFLSNLGIFGALFRAGQFVGDMNRRWTDNDVRVATAEAMILRLQRDIKTLDSRAGLNADSIARLVLKGDAALASHMPTGREESDEENSDNR